MSNAHRSPTATLSEPPETSDQLAARLIAESEAREAELRAQYEAQIDYLTARLLRHEERAAA